MSRSHYLEQAEQRVGTSARKWTLDRLIDVGGMAAVFAATHRNGNKVAIKVLHRQYADMEEAKERFLREGYVANKVGHPNAVTVLDDDELDDGTPFLVMELLEGHPLEAFMGEGKKLSLSQALFVADQVLDVLAAAHDNDIIHRDIKPANIFVTKQGAVKVLDFGLARVLDPGSNYSVTRTGTVIGTASYMSPEQARGKRDLIDHRTDVFAVGAVLLRGLSGRGLHIADNSMDRLLAAMKDPAPLLATLVPSIAPEVAAVVDKALAFQKGDRWPTARAMQTAVRDVFARVKGAAPKTDMPAPSTKVGVSGREDVHVSVSIDSPDKGDSIFVELSDIDTGAAARYQLRRKKSSHEMAAVTGDECISEVSVVLDEDS